MGAVLRGITYKSRGILPRTRFVIARTLGKIYLGKFENMHYFPVDALSAGGCVPYLLTVSDSHELNTRNLTSQATQGWGIGLVRLAKGEERGGERED